MSATDPAALDRLGQTVRLRRQALRLTQEGVARSVGMHRSYVGALERGEINPTYGTLLRVSAALRLPLDQLIAKAHEDDDPPFPS
jgi:transcriptional regulator with XRE-family HTH domain